MKRPGVWKKSDTVPIQIHGNMSVAINLPTSLVMGFIPANKKCFIVLHQIIYVLKNLRSGRNIQKKKAPGRHIFPEFPTRAGLIRILQINLDKHGMSNRNRVQQN